MTDQDEKALLWAAIEDYAGLWESVWELRTLHPEADDSTLLARARTLIRGLVESGLVSLFHCQEPYGELTDVADAEVAEVLADEKFWVAPTFEGTSVRFGATAAGKDAYESLP